MSEDFAILSLVLGTTVVLAFGIPLLRVFLRRLDRSAHLPTGSSSDSARLERIEQAVDAMAIEVERISESQHFMAKLMAERQPAALPLPNGPALAGNRAEE